MISDSNHYCRGCGQPLPYRSKALFHPKCRAQDKIAKIAQKRKRERERMEKFLALQVCPHCSRKFGSGRLVNTSCDPSRSTSIPSEAAGTL